MYTEIEKQKKLPLVVDDYKKFFNQSNDSSWYSVTITSLMDLAVQFESNRLSVLEPIDLFNKIKSQKKIIPGEIIIENQIGLILVLCQTYINEVVKKVKKFYDDYDMFSQKISERINTNKYFLLHNYGDRIKNEEYSKVEIINALANYYKHRDEWGSIVNGQNKKTVELIIQIGGNTDMNIYWVENLQNCIKKIGIVENTSLIKIITILDQWKSNIRDSIKELR